MEIEVEGEQVADRDDESVLFQGAGHGVLDFEDVGAAVGVGGVAGVEEVHFLAVHGQLIDAALLAGVLEKGDDLAGLIGLSVGAEHFRRALDEVGHVGGVVVVVHAPEVVERHGLGGGGAERAPQQQEGKERDGGLHGDGSNGWCGPGKLILDEVWIFRRPAGADFSATVHRWFHHRLISFRPSGPERQRRSRVPSS